MLNDKRHKYMQHVEMPIFTIIAEATKGGDPPESKKRTGQRSRQTKRKQHHNNQEVLTIDTAHTYSRQCTVDGHSTDPLTSNRDTYMLAMALG